MSSIIEYIALRIFREGIEMVDEEAVDPNNINDTDNLEAREEQTPLVLWESDILLYHPPPSSIFDAFSKSKCSGMSCLVAYVSSQIPNGSV